MPVGKGSVSGSTRHFATESAGGLETRLVNLPPCLIGMEACVGAHHLSRKLTSLGHDARMMPAKYVRPYSRGQKNDFRDAEAIAEAVQRPTMKFVATVVTAAKRRRRRFAENLARKPCVVVPRLRHNTTTWLRACRTRRGGATSRLSRCGPWGARSSAPR